MIKLPKPFLGRLILEALPDDTQAYLKTRMGLSEDSILKDLIIADGDRDERTGEFRTTIKAGQVPLQKGKILDMAPDAFGKMFQDKYGTDARQGIKIGDVVMFVPNQTYKLDAESKYHLIADDHIVAFDEQL